MIAISGCIGPEALDPSASAALDAITIDGATRTVLPNGDHLLTIVGETDGFARYEVDVPPGATFVEAIVPSTLDAPFSVIMRNNETGHAVCVPQTWRGWNQLLEGDVRCTAVAAMDAGQKWVVTVTNLLPVGNPTNGLPVEAGSPKPSLPFTLALTFSDAPLDGSAGAIDLAALSQPTFALTETTSEKIAASTDGALLNVEYTLPEGEGPWPTIMAATPYSTPARAAQGRAHDAQVKHWVARGYAFVTMDLRGTGTSAGCYAARDAVDQQDVADAVEWVASQGWSDGKIGMLGFSYTGFTPAAAAVKQPQGLTTIYIGGAAVDMYANYLPGGVDTGRTFTGIVLGYGVSHAAVTTPDDNPLGPVQYTADAFCDPTILLGNDPRHLYDAWWAERNVSALAKDVRVPVFLEQGFYDNNVKANYVQDFFNALDVPKRAVFGSWQHIWAYRADTFLRQLAWMDHWLKGRDTGVMDAPVVEVLTNTRQFRAADTWPTLAAEREEIPLDGGSFLASPPQSLLLGETFETGTDALAEPLYLTGVARLAMDVTLLAGGNVQLEARLYEESADGERTFAGVGWVNAAHRAMHTEFAPLAPGEARAVDLEFLPQDHVFQAGSRVVIALSAATDTWGGPESGVNAPAQVEVANVVLKVPTMPVSVLGAAPRSAS